jgi:hypothetical protein
MDFNRLKIDLINQANKLSRRTQDIEKRPNLDQEDQHCSSPICT